MTEAVPVTTEWKPVKLRVEDYLLLDDAGAFDAYGRTELIEGEVVYMNAQHRPHARVKSRLHLAIAKAISLAGLDLEALVEGSVAMPPHNVPEPDIALTSEPDGDGLIPLSSLALIVEVADTTLRNDLGPKAKIYAREGIPEYWVVDVDGAQIHQLWQPVDGVYTQRRAIPFGTDIASVTIANLTIVTDTLR